MSKSTAEIVLIGSDTYSFKGRRFQKGVIYVVESDVADDLLERSINDEGDAFYFTEPTRREADFEVVDLVSNPRAKPGQQKPADAAGEDDGDEGDDSGAAAAAASQRGRRTVAKKAAKTAKKAVHVGGGKLQGVEGLDEDEGAETGDAGGADGEGVEV